jgi:hypothetical protein
MEKTDRTQGDNKGNSERGRGPRSLEQYDLALQCIETARKNNLRVVPRDNGEKVVLVPMNGKASDMTPEEKEQSKTVLAILRQHKESIKAITFDPETTRKTLCDAQEALSEANTYVMTHLDLVDRLEKAYRIVFPEISECIHGEKGCPEDSVVLCTACAKARGWNGEKYGV